MSSYHHITMIITVVYVIICLYLLTIINYITIKMGFGDYNTVTVYS